MSASNIGLSQLEALQLRNLLGPTGIGSRVHKEEGKFDGSVIVATIPVAAVPDGRLFGSYKSSLTCPSGTGMMRVSVQIQYGGGNITPVLYTILVGDYPIGNGVVSYSSAATGFFYEGVMTYSNNSPTDAPISLNVLSYGVVQPLKLLDFAVDIISFGPYVQQE